MTTEVETRLEKLVVLQARAADLDQARVQADSRAVVRNTWIAAGAAATCAGLLAFLIIRSMMRRLGADPGAAAEVANRIADGDYDFDLDSRPGDASLLGALARMKGSLAQSRLDYEGQLQAIGKAQCVVEFSLDGTILAANANFLKFSGHTLEELKGRHHSTLLDEADRSSAGYRTFWARMKNGEFTAGQYKRIVRDGSERWLQATYNPILGADGRPFKVVKYATDITAQRGADALNAAFRGALDKLRTNVMVADNDCDIIYLNESANELMREVESDFRTALPNFDAKRLVGQSIDAFHREPRHQRRMLAGLTSTHVIETTIGGRVMKAVINPMSDGAGRRLGSVIEWFDRTQEMATERELQGVIAAVKDGELDRRIDLAGKTGFFETLSRGING
ncbi:PAS domain S-box protein, partial [bacterium]